MANLRPFFPYGPRKWKDTSDENALAALALKKQLYVSDAMVRMLAWKYGNTLDTLMSKFGTKTLDSDAEYKWHLVGPSTSNYSLLCARDENGNEVTAASGNIGANQCPFYLVFEKDWTWRGATIVGNMNEMYQFVVLDEPRFEGSNTVDIYAA